MKKLFIIKLNDDINGDYDEFDGFVVRSTNEESAWKIAEELVGDSCWSEQRASYFNRDTFSIKELNFDGEDGVILASYNAG